MKALLAFLRGMFGAGGDVPKPFMKFLRTQTCFTAIIQIDNVFMNTFLLRATGDSAGVMKYNMVLGAVQPAAMLLAIYLAGKISLATIQRIGLSLYALVYVFLILFGEACVDYSLLLSSALSIAAGFYYVTYAAEIVAYTDDEHRDAAYGLMSTIGGVLSMGLPWLAGLLVGAFRDFTGYRLLFFAGMIMAAAAFLFTFKLDKVQSNVHFPDVPKVFRAMVMEKGPRSTLTAAAISAAYSGAMSFYLTLLLYNTVQSEALTGFNSSLCGMVTIFACAMYRKVVHPARRTNAMLLGITVALAAVLPLYFSLTPLTIILFGVVLNTFATFITMPPLTSYFSVVQAHPLLSDRAAEVHALREWWVAAGRVVGISLALILPDSNVGAVTVIVCLLVLQYVNVLMVKRMGRFMEEHS